MSTQNPSYGTKVKDPDAPMIQEGAGAIASDSLAAESDRSGGKFSANRDSEPLGVKGSNSTFANENTSGAVKLDAAADKQDRLEKGGENVENYGKGPNTRSKTNTEGEVSAGIGGADAINREAVNNSDGGKGPAQSAGNGAGHSHADPAPTYVNNLYIRDKSGPKGKNLKEGGDDFDDSKNVSWTAEVGSEDDPARLAEEKFLMANSASVKSAGLPAHGGKLTPEGTAFDPLDPERKI